VTVLPSTALTARHANPLVKAVHFADPCPVRRVALAWRRGFHRAAALEKLVSAVRGLALPIKTL